MTLFRDRDDAGQRLAQALRPLLLDHPLVLGIPRGGVVVAAAVARELNGDLGVVVARKLRAPHQPELAIGAITSDGVAWINESLAVAAGADDRYLEQEKQFQAGEARRREEVFDGHRRPPAAGRTVLVVDDGLATGATALAAIRAMKAAGARRVILAVPVAPPESLERMREEADQVVCPFIEGDFYAIGQFYVDFRPIGDDEVRRCLAGFQQGTVAG
ncbi:MAG: phosphoribosyltransferase [Dehalococcoidia bacterium]|nr:MAG: phosphoribosyltransferase [bacterium]MCE7928522.1 phosphoribosyltransferase [Chloroflexi bacterium CFX7]MCK6565872.1 phosphoribosyltransferase [Dehalococcoidia bacterium]MCL4230019.1 phosphoribosyltransferase [Dehalococcoidia bacterium]NUQ55073.1 phosphoribosyltransferase [Dehalococcoidia bacterium]